MTTLNASTIAYSAKIPLVKIDDQFRRWNPRNKLTGPANVRICTKFQTFDSVKMGLCKTFQPRDRIRPVTHSTRVQSASSTCAAALNARCAAVQTQPVTRSPTTITNAPAKCELKSPIIDDGGAGFPPRNDGGGGGGGGGGENFSGGFFLFGFLLFLQFLKDQENEEDYAHFKRKRALQF